MEPVMDLWTLCTKNIDLPAPTTSTSLHLLSAIQMSQNIIVCSTEFFHIRSVIMIKDKQIFTLNSFLWCEHISWSEDHYCNWCIDKKKISGIHLLVAYTGNENKPLVPLHYAVLKRETWEVSNKWHSDVYVQRLDSFVYIRLIFDKCA